jgi:hypothetical protein
MSDPQAIKHFVVEDLGCQCPDEVFEKIVLESDRPPIDGVAIDHRINIGDRLLVYLADGQTLHEPAHQLAALVAVGLADRDRHRFNRFRLVVVTTEAERDERALRPLFEQLAGRDERTHLHVVTPAQVAALSR